MIEIVKLTKRFGAAVAVDHLDLVVEAGDIFGFIGPNGAGKTTTLKILATLLRPDSGQAWIAGYNVLQDGEMVRRAIGYMPDFFGIYDEMKVSEYLDFFAAAYGISASQRPSIVNDVLELTDLSSRKDDMIQHLSRGMQQRLSLARVLVHDPDVLLLDEPASGLDPRARIELKALLQELKQMGKTILVSSHILPELAAMCNKVAIIERGRLLCSGPVDEILRRVQPARHVVLQVRGDMATAHRVLLENGISRVESRDGLLDVELPGQDYDIATLTTALFRAGLPVTRLEESQPSLEEVFVRLTEGA